MGKGSLAALLLIVLVVVVIGILIRTIEVEGEERVRLGMSFGATVVLVCLVFFLALYLGHLRTRGLYIVT
jgi:hypothetical protein